MSLIVLITCNGGVCAVVRIGLVAALSATDLTWGAIGLDITATLETNIGIIAAFIPTLKPLYNPALRWRRSKYGWSRKLTEDSERHPAHTHTNLTAFPSP
ncbi:hypothetical protein ABVK25_008071 [Lepraria finkii]|uniref:Uncharacterized protein n=1 Tax=Lepraria finkii TaxID=1340010 RepID=A0ABR4B183_9LECA